MNLLERWIANDFEEEKILSEIKFLLNATHNGYEVFCVDENGKRIKYCVPYVGDSSNGQKSGICYSEETAIAAIKYVLNEFGFLFLSWLKQGEEKINFCLKLKEPISYTIDENGIQQEIYSTMFVLRKCKNKAGFCVESVVPILDYGVICDE